VTGATESHAGPTEWSTANNVTYGGIASLGSHVFVTDMDTANAAASGLIRFDTTAFTSERFATTFPGAGPGDGVGEYIDVTVGLDGDLYALRPGGSPSGTEVDVWDPSTLAFKRRVAIGGDHRAIAVDTNGDIFAITFGCTIDRFTSDGTAAGSLATVAATCGDLDLNPAGKLVSLGLGTDARVLLTDRTLASFQSVAFTDGTATPTLFVAWTDPR
jgi:hypothetical protein